jgi:hypothetical protein
LELRVAPSPSPPSLKGPLDKPPLVAKQARAMLAALTRINADGFATAFGGLLSGVPFDGDLAKPFKAFLLTLAGQGVRRRGGRFEAHLRAATGNDFIVELACGRLVDLGPVPAGAAGQDERIKKRLKKLTAKALVQIEEKNTPKGP